MNAIFGLDDLVTKCIERGTTFNGPDLKGAWELLFDVASGEVANGNGVNTPLVNIRPSIKGVFKNAGDGFDPSRHVKKATLSAGTLLISKMKTAKVEKITMGQPSPMLAEFTDINTGTTDSLLTPGGMGSIIGSELKYNPENPSEGIWFVPEDGSTAVKVNVVGARYEGSLMFLVPAELQSGRYTLEVRKGYGINANLRSGSLNEILEVA